MDYEEFHARSEELARIITREMGDIPMVLLVAQPDGGEPHFVTTIDTVEAARMMVRVGMLLMSADNLDEATDSVWLNPPRGKAP